MLDKVFKLSENGTTVRKEVLAGLITFLTMAYILVVNPDILGTTGMDKDALFTATALGAIVATVLMGLLANLPVAQASGMGLNTFFAFTIVGAMGCTWQFALTAVFLEGIIFIILTFLNVREMIIKSIPAVLKNAIPVGIGMFVAFIGFKNAGIVTSNPATFISLGDFSMPGVWIALVGLIVTVVLYVLNIQGAMLLGIVAATIFGFILGEASLPQGAIISTPPSIEPIFAQFEWTNVLSIDMLIVVFVLLLVNLFDTVGTLIAVMSKIGGVDKDGNFPQMKKALFADAIGTTIGSIFGTSTVTSYVESASGVTAGGRTGLTAIATALFFVLALFFHPIFSIVPAQATAAPLIIIGFFMMYSVMKIDFGDMSEGLPAFLTIAMMPFTYSIANGIAFGVLSFVFIKLLSGKFKDITITVVIVSMMFLIKIVLDAMHITA
ncbi:NCS2 family permease [Dysgonomonas massiliensis]|uniref:NCS2 family permease n=1 Tax=Dysgonomonas massiliensis TaxID=2040292 RepID=UPI000C7892D7|nr:NCS2 family permease [Dysgonomonas massiliensis]